MDLLSLVPYARDCPGSENCLNFPVLLGTLLGPSVSFKVGQTGSMPLDHPGTDGPALWMSLSVNRAEHRAWWFLRTSPNLTLSTKT